MSVSPLSSARVSLQMRSTMLNATLLSNQQSMLQVEQQISTGQQLSQTSDDPAAAIGILQLQREISGNQQFTSNLNFASGFLSTADSALGSLTTLINQAQGIASSQIGTGSTADERAAQAAVVDSLLSQAASLANQKYQNQSVFGGQNGTQDVFTAAGGGYKYNGSQQGQGILDASGGQIQYTVNGNDVFGGQSSQVGGYQTLTPALTNATPLADLQGATLSGISVSAPIDVTINTLPTPTAVSVDFSKAATAGDVVSIFNAAMTAAGSDASLSLSGGSFSLTGDSTSAITIADPANGGTAAALGLVGAVAAGGSLTGTSVGPQVTTTTPLSSLNNGLGIDPTGIKITNGANSATVTLAGLTTVQDLLNAIDNSGTNVRAEINATGSGINLFNPVSGTAMTIGENGGQTAQQLGIRSFSPGTSLAALNNGAGLTPIAQTVGGPKGQILITKTDGTNFAITTDGITTPSQLIAAINTASGNTTVTATLNATGNGISLTDSSGGPGNLAVTAGSNFVSNGSSLGILGTGTGGTLTGSNIAFSTDDLQITRKDGTSFTVNMTGTASVQDVLNRINSADGNGGANHVTAALNTVGNGIQLSDASAGPGMLTVTTLNASPVAQQLGLLKTAPGATPGLISGDDVNPLQPQGLFSSLTLLRNALASNDSAGIAQAAALLQADSSRTIRAQGTVGAREKDLANRKTDANTELLQLQSSLSTLQNTDMTTAISMFQQLQTSYQGALKVAGTMQNLSLINFLT